jgi:hypothetical protein
MTRRHSANPLAAAALLASTGCAAVSVDEPIRIEPLDEARVSARGDGEVQVVRAALRGDVADVHGVDGDAFLTTATRDGAGLHVEMYVSHEQGVAMVSLAIDESTGLPHEVTAMACAGSSVDVLDAEERGTAHVEPVPTLDGSSEFHFSIQGETTSAVGELSVREAPASCGAEYCGTDPRDRPRAEPSPELPAEEPAADPGFDPYAPE